MARSLGIPGGVPPASFTHAFSGTKFSIDFRGSTMLQRMERNGTSVDYKIAYALGSGSHAISYLIQIDNHLFQSPICYYPRRERWDMAPGYEKSQAPNFYRPITPRCLFCHVGRALPVPETLNSYQNPPFAAEGITCARCHGPTAAHLHNPIAGNIINPAKLPPRARDSVCEQCHLGGESIVLNPGERLTDFHPGMKLEDVYTVYVFAPSRDPRHPDPLSVVSQSQQLALSLCARRSNGKLWCGTCHDPHRQPKNASAYYRSRCLSCHGAQLLKTHPKPDDDCIGCHMPRLPVVNGAHTIFTDHRIAVYSPQQIAAGTATRPEKTSTEATESLVAWQKPPAGFATRNLGLAKVEVGERVKSFRMIYDGYQLLLKSLPKFPDDPEVLTAMGQVLLGAHRAQKATLVFDRAIQLEPSNASNYLHAALAYKAMDQDEKAASLLNESLQLDPLLQRSYRELSIIYSRDHKEASLQEIRKKYEQAFPGGNW